MDVDEPFAPATTDATVVTTTDAAPATTTNADVPAVTTTTDAAATTTTSRRKRGTVARNTRSFIIPPPLARVVEEPTAANSHVPGEIVVSPTGQLLRRYFVFRGFNGDTIEHYNRWVTFGILKQLQNRPIEVPDGSSVRVARVRWNRPPITIDGVKSLLTPQMCRDRSLTYSAGLVVDLEQLRDGQAVARLDQVVLGRVPILLGSVLDNLMTLKSDTLRAGDNADQALARAGEDPADPFGYFVIKGTEKVLLIQERLRFNRPILFTNKKGSPVCRITCSTISGQSIVELSRSTQGGIRIYLRFLGKDNKSNPNTLSVFQIYRLLGVVDNEAMMALVLQFTRPEWSVKVGHVLTQSILELLTVGDDIEDIRHKRNTTVLPNDIFRNVILQMIEDTLFPQMAGMPVANRLNMLSSMVARFAEHLAGLRPLDDRDNWGFKQLQGPGYSMESLFYKLWEKQASTVEAELYKKQTRFDLDAVALQIKSSIITDDFVSAFSPNSWGVKDKLGRSKVEGGVSDILKRANLLDVFAHLTLINTPSSRQAKTPSIRMVQMSQVGYVDTAETPEGGNCGLVKHKTTTCYISQMRDDRIILEQLLHPPTGPGYISAVPTEDRTSHLVLNGKSLGFCNGRSCLNFVVSLRRDASIGRDTCIVLDPDNCLWIFTDSNRPTRPLLIVDNNEAVIRSKRIQLDGEPGPRTLLDLAIEGKIDFDRLVAEGAIEYIDAMEQEYTLIAQSLDDLDASRGDLQSTAAAVEQAQVRVNELLAIQAAAVNVAGPTATTTTGDVYDEEFDPDGAFETAAGLASDAANVTSRAALAEAENELAQALSIHQTAQQRQEYTHCEMDPNAILSVSASVMPLPNHCQGPRVTYQCECFDELVMLASGQTAKIGELKNGDVVMTIDPISHQMTTTSIKNHFVIDAASNGKKVYAVTTLNGRTIKATQDHPFLTLHGFVPTTELDTQQHQVCIRPCASLMPWTETTTILTADDFTQMAVELGMRNELATTHCQDLQKLGLLPLTMADTRCQILARMLGYLQADGHLRIHHNSGSETVRFGTRWTFGRPADADTFNTDLVSLGFNAGTVEEQVDTYTSTQTTHHTWNIRINGALATLMAVCGGVAGRKTVTHANPIPEWIMHGPVQFKREFVAGFMGGDGCKIGLQVRKYKTKQGSSYTFGRIVQHKSSDHLESSLAWFAQLVQLFTDLGIKTGAISAIPAHDNKYRVELAMCREKQNLLSFIDNIGYRYASTKAGDSLIVTEWLRYTNMILTQMEQLRERVYKLHYDDGWTHPRIAKHLSISVHQSQDYCKSYRAQQQMNLPAFAIKLEQWHKLVTVHNGCIYLPLSSIEQVDNCLVADFETEAATHTFVNASGFVTHNCSMAKQALGAYHSRHQTRFDTSMKMLAFPTRPLFETQINQSTGLDQLPAGQTVILAIMAYGGFNQEDALIVNRSSLQRGLFRSLVYRSYRTQEKKKSNESEERIGKPAVEEGDKSDRYKNLDDYGIVKLGSVVTAGDVLVGKVRVFPNAQPPRKRELANLTVPIGEGGIVDRVLVSMAPDGSRVVKIKLRQMRTPQEGDKFASRYAQKATIGLILNQEDMPFTLDQDGRAVYPDIISNPHALPSRMTIGKLLEVVASKTAALKGERINATAFQKFDIDEFQRTLVQYGYERMGNETMYAGDTGRPLKAKIFTGPCYYQALKHMVADKIQARAQGLVTQVSRQPNSGRKAKGGLRFGEMERDSIISHGGSALLKERMMISSDQYSTVACRNCGTISASSALTGFKCRTCKEAGAAGRITIPYASKLFMQMLSGAGISLTFPNMRPEAPPVLHPQPVQ